MNQLLKPKTSNSSRESKNFNEYLLFLNSLKSSCDFKAVLEVNQNVLKGMAGWEAITSLVCLNHNSELYDIDIRYAWGEEIFKQHLFDHGWSEATLLQCKFDTKIVQHKLIIYLCEASTNLNFSERFDSVPQQFLIGRYWQTVSHLYLLLPLSHPFETPTIAEEKVRISYATTHTLSQKKPELIDYKTETLLFLPPNPCRLGEGGLRTKGLFKSTDADQSLISIITVVYNGERYIEQAIQSVINQSHENVEYIIIDGGSTDGTLDIIRKYEDQINYWVSEPDAGLYDAMNKGTLLACGSHTLHTNADDLLFQPNSLQLRDNDANHLRSVLIYLMEDDLIVKSPPQKNYDNNPYMNIINVPVHHPGFIGLKTPASLFDSSYKIIADAIVIANKIKTEKIDISSDTLAIYRRCGGIADENNFQILKEDWRAVLPSKDIRVFIKLLLKEIKCRIREIAKLIGLVKLKRKYLG